MANAVVSLDDYRRRVADEADLERREYYAELREDEMRRIRRDCERERCGNLLHLRQAEWPAVDRPDTWHPLPPLLLSAAFWIVIFLIWWVA